MLPLAALGIGVPEAFLQAPLRSDFKAYLLNLRLPMTTIGVGLWCIYRKSGGHWEATHTVDSSEAVTQFEPTEMASFDTWVRYSVGDYSNLLGEDD